jgi:hypothetical protein
MKSLHFEILVAMIVSLLAASCSSYHSTGGTNSLPPITNTPRTSLPSSSEVCERVRATYPNVTSCTFKPDENSPLLNQ